MAHATSSMAKNMRRRQRRRRRQKPTKPTTSWKRPEPPVGPAGGATTTSNVYDVPDHLLELILHRLESPVCLVRAASACKRWCRVAADAEFLDGFRSRRVPLIAGHYHREYNARPVFVPTSPASSIHGRHDFSLDFVPNVDYNWEIADVRDSLLLLSKRTLRRADLIVCEPLTRRFRLIPPLERHNDWPCLGLYLLKDDRSAIGLSTFKVIAVSLRGHLCDPRLGVPAAFVYSASGTRRRGCWTRVECPWKTKINHMSSTRCVFTFAGRANGSLYWGVGCIRAGELLLVLDEATRGVSQVTLPIDILGTYERNKFRILEGDHGALRAVRATGKDLKIFALLRGSDEWVLEGHLRLTDVTRGLPGSQDHHFQNGGAVITAAHETYLVMAPSCCTKWQFTVDLKTLALEAVRDRIGTNWLEYPYELPWPPTLKYCS